ncbi:hypothetical protein HPP92_026621 [Vanilla planifolia]|uniref:SMP domain-containing protein n=1 Tax=Vanilla planifolia TaxID=51239 RepID=A0A835PDK3_VANPL|nr:hypothetical protein HPP92_026621 [Vanilla planifolia]
MCPKLVRHLSLYKSRSCFLPITSEIGTMSKRQQPDESIKYGDVFPVQGDLARETVRPGDASMMQSAENLVTGRTLRGAAASVMQSAAAQNERACLVGHDEISCEPAIGEVSVAEVDISGRRVIRETVAGQTVAQFPVTTDGTGGILPRQEITVGEALEGAALMQGDKPIEQSDAAAVQAAEARATGPKTLLGGVASAAQSAANVNTRISREEDKIAIGDVLMDATAKMVADRAVTREDAEAVLGAEVRNRPDMKTVPGGVAESMAAAARLNQSNGSA